MELGLQSSQHRHAKRGFVPPFRASSRSLQMAPSSPPMLDDILSQMSQRDFPSTQLFRSNSEFFNNNAASIGTSTAVDLLDNERSFLSSSRHSSQNHDKWITNEAHISHSRYSQPSLFIEDEDDYGGDEILQDSPELFTQRSDFHTDPTGDSEGLALNDYDLDREEIQASYQVLQPQYNLGTPGQLVIPAYGNESSDASSVIGLRSVNEIPNPLRSVFSKFPYFNIVQSKVFEEVMYTDIPMVVCAPTGSGKTVIFELAIIRQLMNSGTGPSKAKVVYMAPMKALCSERFMDWKDKFGPFGLKCKEVTGDSELDDYYELQNVHIIMTTPEKWDSMTRKWRDNRSLVQSVRLFLIDEVHLLNDDSRGATVEAVISRMKTVQSTMTRNNTVSPNREAMRLIAISATIPNIEDIAAWLGGIDSPASHYSMDDSHRPVKLRKVVLGFPKGSNFSDFRFDLSLNYKLSGIIQTYSDRKPTLVFCSTRKSAQQAAQMLVKDARFIMNSQHRQRLQRTANSLHDSKLRELVICGIGYHHAGLDPTDRRNVETMFIKGDIPVLFATSTLAVGVNLPAHLVIIKSTAHYVMGVFQEYSETQILQMIGRAGRPQFDTSATAVILTTSANKEKYTGLLEGTQKLESSLHHHLIEHLNAEIVLNTITDVTIALEWLKSTFLYIRILKNPLHYGIPEGLKKECLEQKLQDICLKSLNTLERAELIKMDDGFDLKPTEAGRLMARYCIAYDSMKQFLEIKGKESLSDLVELVSKCKEFSDVKLRVNEKRALNGLNKDKNKPTIRFPINGKIKTTDQKVNCLIQATLGNLAITDFTLSQDVTKIFRAGQRITRCLTELQMLKNEFLSLQNSIILAKCIRARLWENSKFVSRQLEKIGPMLSTMMVNAGLTTFKKIEETNPREIEMIVNRHPPFGSQIREAVSNLPKYELSVQQAGRHQPNRAEIVVTVTMTNYLKRKEAISTGRNTHFCILLVSDADNKVVFKQRLGDAFFMKEGYWSKRVDVQRTKVQSSELSINLISQEYVGLDVSTTYSPYYSGGQAYLTVKRESQASNPLNLKRVESNVNSASTCSSIPQTGGLRVPCSHRCSNKDACGHDCCKQGVISKFKKKKAEMDQSKEPPRLAAQITPCKDKAFRKNLELAEPSHMDVFLQNLHQRTEAIPGKPTAKRLKSSAPETGSTDFVDLTLDERFGYTRKAPISHQRNTCHGRSENDGFAPKRDPGKRCWEEIDWYKRRVEGNQETNEDSTYDASFEGELPSFLVDEMWNDDDLPLVLSDDSDLIVSPVAQSRQNSSRSHCSKPTASKKRQEISDEFRQPLSRSSQFIIGCQAKKTGDNSSSGARVQSRENSKRISRHWSLSPAIPDADDIELISAVSRIPRRVLRSFPAPPPTPGADDFERITNTHGDSTKLLHALSQKTTFTAMPTSPTPAGNALDQSSDQDCNKRPNNKLCTSRLDSKVDPTTTRTSHIRGSWKDDFPLDDLEMEEWDIFPDFTTPQTSVLNQPTKQMASLSSNMSSTSLDPPVLSQSGSGSNVNNAHKSQEDFSTAMCEQSPISSSFFCSKSFTSTEQEHEEQDAFAGIFQGLL